MQALTVRCWRNQYPISFDIYEKYLQIHSTENFARQKNQRVITLRLLWWEKIHENICIGETKSCKPSLRNAKSSHLRVDRHMKMAQLRTARCRRSCAQLAAQPASKQSNTSSTNPLLLACEPLRLIMFDHISACVSYSKQMLSKCMSRQISNQLSLIKNLFDVIQRKWKHTSWITIFKLTTQHKQDITSKISRKRKLQQCMQQAELVFDAMCVSLLGLVLPLNVFLRQMQTTCVSSSISGIVKRKSYWSELASIASTV
jgi:hypothetical protein